MTDQPEALRLADALIAATGQTDAEDDVIYVARWFVEDAAAELCRLHAEIERLRYHLRTITFSAELAQNYVAQLSDDCEAAVKRCKS